LIFLYIILNTDKREKLLLTILEMIDFSKNEDSMLENAKKHLEFAKSSLAHKKHQLQIQEVIEVQDLTESDDLALIYSKYIEIMLELVELNLSDLVSQIK
jgi:hypothetical protein